MAGIILTMMNDSNGRTPFILFTHVIRCCELVGFSLSFSDNSH